jgi:hypothetical protein
MNISRIRSEVEKLQALAAERARIGEKPVTIIVLPTNSREPDLDAGEPLPRIAWRNECAVCIVYNPKAEAPTAEEIALLIEGQT